MAIDRGFLRVVLISGAAVSVAFPFLGLFGSFPLGATGFFAIVLVRSGFRAGRAALWAAVTGALFIGGVTAPDPIASLSYGLGALVFFAGALVPAFRERWFGQKIE